MKLNFSRSYWLYILIIILASCLGCGGEKETHPSLQNAEAEEYAVYDAIIKEMYIRDGVGLVVIEDQTYAECSVENYLNEYCNDRNLLYRIKVRLFFASASDALKDFEKKNKESHPLKELFALPLRYTLISKDEYDEIFRKKECKGWKVYHERFPDSPSILSLSRIGFNTKIDKAFVYVKILLEEPLLSRAEVKSAVEYQSYYVVLAKRKGTWKIKKKMLAYVGYTFHDLF